jgi:two-component system, NarL family, nitrate/nitrite response regulator NarL
LLVDREISCAADRTVTRTIRVVIAITQPLFGDAVERVIRQCSAFQLVGQAAEGRTAMELLRTLEPDVAVLEPSLGGLDRRRLQRLVGSEGLATRLLYVSDDADQADAYDLIEEGAAGFLTKSTSPEQLREAILAVAAGRDFLCSEIVPAVTSEIRLRRADHRPILSPREREILNRIAAGESVPTIARAIHLSVSTVKTHVHHLYEKLEVSDRAAAVAVAMRRGLIA